MCLEKVHSGIKKKLVKKGYGWKVFWKTDDGLMSEIAGSIRKTMPVGKWINEKDFRGAGYGTAKNIKDYHVTYPIGFHVLSTRYYAKQWANRGDKEVKKVKFRKVVATGVQIINWTEKDDDCVIAKEIFIEP